ncbi:MAG: hypothetical protein JNM74_05060 [Myxococcales bacterium]|nr:hypothetical protein [Myxococcales bacterium]
MRAPSQFRASAPLTARVPSRTVVPPALVLALVGCRAILGIDEKVPIDAGRGADAMAEDAPSDGPAPDAGSADAACPDAKTSCGAVCRDTSQDPAHCGACNRVCARGDTCIHGACAQAVASGVGALVTQADVSANGYLFWSDTTGGAVRRMAIDTSTVDAVMSPPAAPLGYRRVGSRIVVLDRAGSIYSRVVSGPGAVTTLASGQTNATFVEADDTYAYFGAGGEVRRVPREGGSVEALAGGLDRPTYVRLSTAETGALYALCEGTSTPGVYVLPRNGGTATRMLGGPVKGLAVGLSHVVTGRTDRRELVAIDRNPPYTVSLLVKDVDVTFIALEGASVFATTTDGTLLRAELGVEGALVLGRGFPELGPVAPSSSDRLYWFSAGTLYSGPKSL